MYNINDNSSLRRPMYDPIAVQPMRDELKYVGFKELLTPDDVNEVLLAKDDSTTFVVINSVCGCAAGSARPAAALALQNKIIPDKFVTVFAGMERDAVDTVRNSIFTDIPPSSPSMGLVKNGKVLFFLPRHHIEGRSPEEIAALLKQVFNENCNRKGPSIPKEDYDKLVYAKMCGSKIPAYSQN